MIKYLDRKSVLGMLVLDRGACCGSEIGRGGLEYEVFYYKGEHYWL